MKSIRICGDDKADGSFSVKNLQKDDAPLNTIVTDDWNTITQILRIKKKQPEQTGFPYVFDFVLE